MSSSNNNTIFKKTSFLAGNNSEFINEFYADYISDPSTLPDSWRKFFDGLSDDEKLIYNDIRKFGFIKFIKRVDLDQNTHLKFLGPEPLSTEFNIQYFKKYLIGKKRTIKNILMDQKFVSGIGNIYANEILFLSKVKPTRNVKTLRVTEIKKIVEFTKKVFYGL